MGTLREKLNGRLRVLRAERGLSQANVADMSGMSEAGYAKIERGLSDVSLDRVEALARAFGVEPEELMGGAEWRMYINSTGAGSVIGTKNTADSTILGSLLEKMIDRVAALERELSAERTKNAR